MGQSASTERALNDDSHGAITFSNEVLKKVSEEVESELEQKVEERLPEFMTDKEWFEKLKEIDDKHSMMSGFTIDAFNNLAEKIEYKLNDVDTKVPYAHDMLIDTLKSKMKVSLFASREVQNFIECADIYQKKMLKRRLFEQKLEESQRRRNRRRFIY